MNTVVVQRLQVLAEMDSVTLSLRRWIDQAPEWSYTAGCRALMRRLLERMDLFRARIESPLVVATFGGTGVGKSRLVQAIVGEEIVRTGRTRPTTRRPTLITAPGLTPDRFGIPPECVEHVTSESPVLSHLAIIDCPDPDTTDLPDAAGGVARGSNLEALRTILPHCDVLLVVSTQQKYRDSRVHEELLAAAAGLRFVFVQTHADIDADIRDDWRRILPPGTLADRIFFVDSVAGLAAARRGESPDGDLALLLDFLRRELAGTAATRIRRENFWELVTEALDACRARLDQGVEKVARLEAEIAMVRRQFAERTATRLREELAGSRRLWEHRLAGQALDTWGASPLQTIFRAFHRFGDVAFGSLMLRARTPAQLALWGAAGSVRRWQQSRREREADQTLASDPEFWGWDPVRLRESALVLEGYCSDAGLLTPDGRRFSTDRLVGEATRSAEKTTGRIAVRVQQMLQRLAARNAGPFSRLLYESIFWIVTILLVARPAKNFFFDSWWPDPPAPMLGFDVYLLTFGWFLLACFLLYLHFCRRLRRGLQRELRSLRPDDAELAGPADGGDWPELFGDVEHACASIHEYRRELDRISAGATALRHRLEATATATQGRQHPTCRGSDHSVPHVAADCSPSEGEPGGM